MIECTPFKSMRMAVPILAVLFAGGIAPASAQNVPAFNDAAAQVSDELTRCAAYFAIVTQAMDHSEADAETARSYSEAGGQALDYALVLAELGQLDADAVISGYNRYGEDLSQEIGSQFSRVDELIDRHGAPCNALLDDVETSLMETLIEAVEDEDARRALSDALGEGAAP